MSDFYSQRRIKKTRKPHKCQWCWGRIAAGEAAVYQSVVCEGDFSAQYLHPECAQAAAKYVAVSGEPDYPDEPMPRGGIATVNDCAEPAVKATDNPLTPTPEPPPQ